MGIDFLQKDRITRWALKSNTLESDCNSLKMYNTKMGEIVDGSRNTEDGALLEWKLTLPLGTPEVEIVPFLIDWGTSGTHPCNSLPDSECKLIKFSATHPSPMDFEIVFKNLNCNFDIQKNKQINMSAIIAGPKGTVFL